MLTKTFIALSTAAVIVGSASASFAASPTDFDPYAYQWPQVTQSESAYQAQAAYDGHVIHRGSDATVRSSFAMERPVYAAPAITDRNTQKVFEPN